MRRISIALYCLNPRRGRSISLTHRKKKLILTSIVLVLGLLNCSYVRDESRYMIVSCAMFSLLSFIRAIKM